MNDDSAPGNLFVDLPGLTVGALTWGPSDGPLALLLHGFPDTAWSWRHVGPRLAARGWRVVAPFSRGYAPTGLATDGNYQTGALVGDVVRLHAVLGGDRGALLVGHDWGALTAYGVASYAPDLFGSVVTMAVPPIPTLRRVLGNRHGVLLAARQLRSSWYILANQVPGASERVFTPLVTKLWRDWSPGYSADEDLAHLADAMPDRAHRAAAIAYYRASLQPWRQRRECRAEQRAVMQAPAVPVLFLHGADDGCVRRDIAEQALPDLVPGSVVEVVDGAGHFLQVEQPDEIVSQIARFLDARAVAGAAR